MSLGVGMKSNGVVGVSEMFFCVGLVMFSLFLATGGTSTTDAGTYMQMPNMNNTCNI